jgi:hypothetical protein
MLEALFLFWAAAAFERIEIDANPPQSPYIKAIADFNGDRKPDIAIGGAKGPLVWYANPGWTKTVIAEGGYQSVDAEAGDIDRDGDLDLVVGGVLWYENPGSRPGLWRAHPIATHRTHDVEVGDLDRDGKLDVVVRGQTGFKHNEGHRILVFRQVSPGEWKSHEIRCPEGEGLELADLDSDGDPDIVIGARWYENAGGQWREHTYAPGWTYGDTKPAVGDFNGDRKPDIALAPAEYKGGSYRMSWFAAPDWKEHVIEERIESVVHAMDAADFDGDGQVDIAIAQMHQGAPPQDVAVYLNRGRGAKWTRQVLSSKGSHNIVAADVDGDGAVDILGANHAGEYQPVELWRNRSRK